MVKYVYDTNALLTNPHLLDLEGQKILPYVVLKELDKLKMGMNDVAFQAREAVRKIKNMKSDILFDDKYEYSETLINDDLILNCAKGNDATLISGDFLVQIKAESQGIECLDLDLNKDDLNDYTGVQEVFLPDYEVSALYEHPNINILGLKENEYVIVNNENGKYVDKFKWKKGEYTKVKGYKIKTKFFGEVSPRNKRQEMLFDLLQDDDIKIKKCVGVPGAGKDFTFIAHAISMLEQHKIDKIIFCRNQIELEHSPGSGYRKGENFDKMIEFAMPLADHVGGVDELRFMCEKGTIELQDMSRMRGRDVSNSIILVSEFQNSVASHARMLVGRIADNTQLWINGDMKQVDHRAFAVNNGLKALNKLSGQELYGQVYLDKTERSKAADLSELI